MNSQKRALVLGAGGFIGHHLATRLEKEGYWVAGVDIKYPEYSKLRADKFIIADLRGFKTCQKIFDTLGPFDEVYQLAADMGGAQYLFTGEHDADVMSNSAQININISSLIKESPSSKVFFSSSACIYPKYNQSDPNNPKCAEDSAYPADPDSEYGWEKLFGERLYLAFYRNYGMNVRIARFHNVFGPESAWTGGKEKAPTAICRKVAQAKDGGEIEIFGDGNQTRSFLYIDECLEGVRRLMSQEEFVGPVNIGSEEMVTINELAHIVMKIAGKQLGIRHIDGPQGVRGRNSDNRLLKTKLGWSPSLSLKTGFAKTYFWVETQVRKYLEKSKAEKEKNEVNFSMQTI